MPLPPAPPAPTITGTLFRAVFVITVDGMTTEFTQDYVSVATTTPPAADIAVFAASLESNVSSFLVACLPPAAIYQQITVECLTSGTVPSYVFPENDPGTVTGGHLPIMTSAVIQKRTGLKGKHGRGWLACSAVPVGFVTSTGNANILNNAGTTAYGALANALIAPVTGTTDTYLPAVATRPPKGTPLYTHAAVVTAMPVRLLLGTIRRRQVGRGI